MIHIKVPATSANLGPGFDCMGIAFKLCNNLWVEKTTDTSNPLVINNLTKSAAPLNESNLIYASIRRFYRELGIKTPVPPLRLTQKDNIPMTRGLGSSAACVTAGLLAANEISGARISRGALCDLAAKIEGHPDNSAPALLGGVVIGAFENGRLCYIKIHPKRFSRLRFACLTPNFTLKTQKARDVLPRLVDLNDAVFNVSRAALLTAALLTGDYDKLSVAMTDRLHQSHRAALIPGLCDAFALAADCGAKGAFLSGAGPSVIAVYQNADFAEQINKKISRLPNKWRLRLLEPDGRGATVRVVDK